ncbi:Hexose transporter HXT15 [Cyphellophora attinorum]|uniref:Hexose transporter HXT15 n=1 Tax=Cyphellophora attinorum TaxID=1664694 RepID=A0A0N0NKB3_9EURO|nr:Hexose transporter HXT15 [Phialophora attinorum]KPI37838.1 Hexose transporter HXT15 [Phialophora attinorum]
MSGRSMLSNLAVAKYANAIRSAPRSVICNRALLISSLLYALSAIPMTWDQGSSSVVPSLPGFQNHFSITSGANPEQIRNFVSLVYIGYSVGAALSFFINDNIGRLQSYRLYVAIWSIGQIIAITTPNVAGLYAARIVSGIGIGALSVSGPMSLAEIAPTEIRGLLTSWYVVAMGLSLFTSIFCVYGIYLHVAVGRIQYQIAFFAPVIFMALCLFCTYGFSEESPRWLMMVGKKEQALTVLARLRGLPLDHPRVQQEIVDIDASVRSLGGEERPTFLALAKETFTKKTNLRRLQQTVVSYALAQLSGANSITSYFVPYVNIISPGGGTTRNIFLSGMYGFSKFWFSLISSFLFIDALGRRNSLFIGTALQAISDIYIGAFVKCQQDGSVSTAASQGAIAMLFVHAFGYAVGLLTLPYVFGGELWPNHIRSFGGALSQTFHWLFIYAMKFSVPSLLKETDDWGAFIFFASWCLISLVYVFFCVPEVAGLSVEEIEEVFKGSWFNAYKRSKAAIWQGVEDQELARNTSTKNNLVETEWEVPLAASAEKESKGAATM